MLIKSIYLGTSRHAGIDVFGRSPHNIMTLAWPLILQWRRESAKYPDTELRVILPDNAGWSTDIKTVKRDALTEYIHRYAWS